jgi:ribosomal-protein-alanine N-acetyltransferase
MKKILETERTYLREFEVSDAPFMYNLNLDPEVIKYAGDSPFRSIEEAEEFMRGYSQYRDFGYGRWAVIRKSDEMVLGWCGLKFHPEERYTDLGYRFFMEFWGAGYATETSKACLEFGFRTLNLESIVGRVMPENTASVNVLKKTGMQYWKEDLCDKHPAKFYKIEKEEFLKLNQ